MVDIKANLSEYAADSKGALAINLGLAFLTQVLRIVSMYLLALTIAAPGTLVDYTIITPLIVLILMIPIPLIALGWEQGVFIGMLGLVNVSGEQAFVMSIFNRIMMLFILIPGVICILMGWAGKKESTE